MSIDRSSESQTRTLRTPLLLLALVGLGLAARHLLYWDLTEAATPLLLALALSLIALSDRVGPR